MHKSLHSSKSYCECSTHQSRKPKTEENTPTRKFVTTHNITARGTSAAGANGKEWKEKGRAEWLRMTWSILTPEAHIFAKSVLRPRTKHSFSRKLCFVRSRFSSFFSSKWFKNEADFLAEVTSKWSRGDLKMKQRSASNEAEVGSKWSRGCEKMKHTSEAEVTYKWSMTLKQRWPINEAWLWSRGHFFHQKWSRDRPQMKQRSASNEAEVGFKMKQRSASDEAYLWSRGDH